MYGQSDNLSHFRRASAFFEYATEMVEMLRSKGADENHNSTEFYLFRTVNILNKIWKLKYHIRENSCTSVRFFIDVSSVRSAEQWCSMLPIPVYGRNFFPCIDWAESLDTDIDVVSCT